MIYPMATSTTTVNRIQDGIFGGAENIRNKFVQCQCSHSATAAPLSHLSYGKNPNAMGVKRPVPSSVDAKRFLHSRKQRKTVCFNRTVQIREVKHIRDMNAEESARLWHSRSEYSLMKQQIRTTRRAMRQQLEFGATTECIEDEELCVLGLEWIFRERFHPQLSRHALRYQTLQTVLQEQFLQRQSSMPVDPERLATVCRLATEPSKVIARNLAQSVADA